MFILAIIALIVFLYFILDTIFVDYIKHRNARQMVINDINTFLTKEKDYITHFMNQTTQKFTCSFCQAKEASSNIISLRGLELGKSNQSRPHKYLMNTCHHCAHTEFYNLNIKFKNDFYDLVKPDSLKDRQLIDRGKKMTCPQCKNQKFSLKKILFDRPKFKSLLTLSQMLTINYSCKHCGYTYFIKEDNIA